MKKLKKLPRFKTDEEFGKFWDRHSLADYVQAKDLKPVIFPNLKPTTRSISIRFPEYLIDQVKIEANKLVIPYQSLIKQYVAKGVAKKKK